MAVNQEQTINKINQILSNAKLVRQQVVDNEITAPYGGFQTTMISLVTAVTSLNTTLQATTNSANLP